METNVANEDYGFYMEGLACPPLDDFAFFTTSMAADAPIDNVDFSGLFDDLDDNGDLLIKGSDHHHHQPVAVAPVEKKTKQQHGKGKQMGLLLASKDHTNPPDLNEPATTITNTATGPAPSMSNKLEQLAKNIRVATKPIITSKKRAAAPEDDEHNKLEQSIKKIRHIYDKAAEAKRNRQVVLIDYVPPKPQPRPNRFKSKKLQKLFVAR